MDIILFKQSKQDLHLQSVITRLNYLAKRKDEVSPWLEAFVNARIWVENQNK